MRETETMTATATINATRKILTALGFEIADASEFVADVAELAAAGDREGLIGRIAGGASYGEAAETADAIIGAVA